jgi:copper homeostasis protein (lipoprotein)
MKNNMIFLLFFASLFALACGAPGETTTEEDTAAYSDHNSRTSLDWDGTYYGTLPCADCPGIQTMLTLHADGTYTLSTKYIDRDEKFNEDTGSFEWDEKGNAIKLMVTNDDGLSHQYQVGENKLFKLDRKGNRIEGDLAENYTLTKTLHPLLEKNWVLTELQGKDITESGLKGGEIYLVLSYFDNRAYGKGGCNSYFGTYELQDENRLSFSKIASTLMSCPYLEVEDRYKDVLEKTDSYYVNGDTLQLIRARMAPLAKFVATKEE